MHPGDTVNFVQDWTGEAHTVTLGTRVDEVLSITKPLYEEWGDVPEDQVPPDVLGAYFAAECSLPLLYGCEPPPGEEPPPRSQPRRRAQTRSTRPSPSRVWSRRARFPQDGAPCPTQELGPFDGTEAYYNSGFLGFRDRQGKHFRVEPVRHDRTGRVQLLLRGARILSEWDDGSGAVRPTDCLRRAEVNQQTRQELNEVIEPFRQVYDKATEGQFVFGGEALAGPFSGLVDERVDGSLNEFVPEVIETGVGDPVTWLIFGAHSISFDVPEYFPIYEESGRRDGAGQRGGIPSRRGSARGSGGERPARSPESRRLSPSSSTVAPGTGPGSGPRESCSTSPMSSTPCDSPPLAPTATPA